MDNQASNFVYTGDDVLDVMGQFAQNRHKSVEKLIAKHLRFDELSVQQPQKILEFGAGKGEFINRFTGTQGLDTYVVELDDNYRHQLGQNHKAFKDITEIHDDSLDGIYLIDVLEHLEDDRAFLKSFFQKLKKGGRLFIYVPARMELFSAFDTKIGHFRRYHKKELKNKVKEAGFEVQSIRYHEILGYFAAYFNKLFSKANDGDLNADAVKIYDKVLVPTTNAFEKVVNPPIGKSLYISAVKQ